MKFTLNDCMSRINQVLNYPAISYEDISHFFDQAIYELNTSLHIDIPSVSEMVANNTVNVTDRENVTLLTERPTAGGFESVSKVPTSAPTGAKYTYVCANPTSSEEFYNRKFYIWNGNAWVQVSELYAVYIDYSSSNAVKEAYTAVPVSNTVAVWAPVNLETVKDFDLTTYLTREWWTLFVIPYVCFKFAIRDGESGALYSDEFTQGFQQLQNSYNVPSDVRLCDVAGNAAYTDIVKQNLDNLTKIVKTKAITPDMKRSRETLPTYGGLYENGGWGI